MNLNISVLSYPQIYLYLIKYMKRKSREKEYEIRNDASKLAILGTWITGQEIKQSDLLQSKGKKKKNDLESQVKMLIAKGETNVELR